MRLPSPKLTDSLRSLTARTSRQVLSEAKDLSSLDSSAKLMADKSAPPHPPEDGFVLLAKNDTLNEVGCAPANFDAIDFGFSHGKITVLC